MLAMRKSSERGHAQHGWLDSYHSFSFADYYDPAHMGFSVLRVINEDRVQPGAGFPTHGHRDMEIVSYILDGALEHKDSLGTGSQIRAGEVQRMSAGRGVTHSEFNASNSELVHFLQIWILPDSTGIAPSYEQTLVPDDEKRGHLRLIAGPKGANGAVTIHQDARIYATILDRDDKLSHALARGRKAYVHCARGSVGVNGIVLKSGDALKIENETSVNLTGIDRGEALLFDLP